MDLSVVIPTFKDFSVCWASAGRVVTSNAHGSGSFRVKA